MYLGTVCIYTKFYVIYTSVVHFCINSPIWDTGREIRVVPALCRQIAPLSCPRDRAISSRSGHLCFIIFSSVLEVTKFRSSDIAGRDTNDRAFFSSIRTLILYCFYTRPSFWTILPFLVRHTGTPEVGSCSTSLQTISVANIGNTIRLDTTPPPGFQPMLVLHQEAISVFLLREILEMMPFLSRRLLSCYLSNSCLKWSTWGIGLIPSPQGVSTGLQASHDFREPSSQSSSSVEEMEVIEQTELSWDSLYGISDSIQRSNFELPEETVHFSSCGTASCHCPLVQSERKCSP
jgi:hypothetical protein